MQVAGVAGHINFVNEGHSNSVEIYMHLGLEFAYLVAYFFHIVLNTLL